jgi:hypothetical protein
MAQKEIHSEKEFEAAAAAPNRRTFQSSLLSFTDSAFELEK